MAQSLSHSKWLCKYQIVFTAKYIINVIYYHLRADIEKIIKDLYKWKGIEIIEGRMISDHIHLLLLIPPKYRVSQIMGYLKGKSAMIFERHANLNYKFGNSRFWAEWYYVSILGLDTETIQKHIREQEKKAKLWTKLEPKNM